MRFYILALGATLASSDGV